MLNFESELKNEEEIVSIIRRNGNKEIWKIDFDFLKKNYQDNLLTSIPSEDLSTRKKVKNNSLINLLLQRLDQSSPYIESDNKKTISNIEQAAKILSVLSDEGQIMDFLSSNKDIRVFSDINNFDLSQNIFEGKWSQTLIMSCGARIGKGEVGLKLKFAFDLKNKEPDFVSHDKKIRLAVKYFSNGKGIVKNSDNPLATTDKLINSIKKLSNVKSTPKTIGVVWVKDNVISNLHPENKKQIKEICDKLKNEFVFEHGTNGILAVYNNKSKLITHENVLEELNVNSILTKTKRCMFNLANVENKRTSIEDFVSL